MAVNIKYPKFMRYCIHCIPKNATEIWSDISRFGAILHSSLVFFFSEENELINFNNMFKTDVLKNTSTMSPSKIIKLLTVRIGLKTFRPSVLAHLIFQSDIRSIIGFNKIDRYQNLCIDQCIPTVLLEATPKLLAHSANLKSMVTINSFKTEAVHFPETLKYWVRVQRGWGEGVSLALVVHPSGDGVTIKMPYGVDVLHRPVSHPIFSYWVG